MDFIKELSDNLYDDFINLNYILALRLTATDAQLQIFAERLLNLINKREKIIKLEKYTLGTFISDKNFCNRIMQKFKITDDMIKNIFKINNFANEHKHETRSVFNEKEVVEMYKQLIFTTLCVYNKYALDKIYIKKEVMDSYLFNLLNGEIKPNDEIKLYINVNEYLEDEEKYKNSIENENINLIKIKEEMKILRKEIKLKESQINNMVKQNAHLKKMIIATNKKKKLEEKLNDLMDRYISLK